MTKQNSRNTLETELNYCSDVLKKKISVEYCSSFVNGFFYAV